MEDQKENSSSEKETNAVDRTPRDPITGGPAHVTGGVHGETAPAVPDNVPRDPVTGDPADVKTGSVEELKAPAAADSNEETQTDDNA
jgi:hypothetical protein